MLVVTACLAVAFSPVSVGQAILHHNADSTAGDPALLQRPSNAAATAQSTSSLDGYLYLGWASLADAPEQHFALVQRGDHTRVIRVGDDLEGHVVQRITRDAIVLRSASGDTLLTLPLAHAARGDGTQDSVPYLEETSGKRDDPSLFPDLPVPVPHSDVAVQKGLAAPAKAIVPPPAPPGGDSDPVLDYMMEAEPPVDPEDAVMQPVPPPAEDAEDMMLTRPAIYDQMLTQPADPAEIPAEPEVMPPTDAVPEELGRPGEAPEGLGGTAERSK